MKPKLLLMLILLPFAVAAAQGYKVTHPDGRIEYTDQPVKNAKEINLPDAQGYQSSGNGTASQQGSPVITEQPSGNGGYLQFAIASPRAEETIPNSGGLVSVAVTVAPALQQGHQVVVTLDGREMARGESASFTLSGVERGAHLLSATILDAAGSVVRQADPVTFYIFQQSLLNPNLKK